jgi:hypothetical protein
MILMHFLKNITNIPKKSYYYFYPFLELRCSNLKSNIFLKHFN